MLYNVIIYIYIEYCQFLLDVFLIWYANMHLYCIYSAKKNKSSFFTQVPPAMKSSKCQKSSWSGPNDVEIYSRDCQMMGYPSHTTPLPFPYFWWEWVWECGSHCLGNPWNFPWWCWPRMAMWWWIWGDDPASFSSKFPSQPNLCVDSTKDLWFPNNKVGGLEFAERGRCF